MYIYLKKICLLFVLLCVHQAAHTSSSITPETVRDIRNTLLKFLPVPDLWILIHGYLESEFEHKKELLQNGSWPINALEYSPDGAYCAYLAHGAVDLLNIMTAKSTSDLQPLNSPYSALAFTHDSKHLIAAGEDSWLCVYDIHKKERVRSRRLPDNLYTAQIAVCNFAGDYFAALRGVHTDVWLCSLKNDVLYALSDPGSSGSIDAMALSTCGNVLATGRHGQIALWSLLEQKKSATFKAHDGHAILSLAFDPHNSNSIASASRDKTVCLWDTKSGENVRTFRGHTSDATSVLFDGVNQQLITASSPDNTVRVWDIASSRELQTITMPLISDQPNEIRIASNPSKQGELLISSWGGICLYKALKPLSLRTILKHKS